MPPAGRHRIVRACWEGVAAVGRDNGARQPSPASVAVGGFLPDSGPGTPRRVLPRLQAALPPLPGIIGGEDVRAGSIARSNSLARIASCWAGVFSRDSASSLPSIPRPRANGIICRPSLRRARSPCARTGTGCRAQGKDPWPVLWRADPESSAIVWQPVRTWRRGGLALDAFLPQSGTIIAVKSYRATF